MEIIFARNNSSISQFFSWTRFAQCMSLIGDRSMAVLTFPVILIGVYHFLNTNSLTLLSWLSLFFQLVILQVFHQMTMLIQDSSAIGFTYKTYFSGVA